MALPVFQRTVVTNNGDIVANADVTVFDTATGLKVDLFNDKNGNNPLGNPFKTLSDGLAKFYANPGVVNVTASGPSGSITWTDVHLIDSADIITIGQNFAAVENVSDNLADIQTVEQNLTAINATADNITDITTTAANITAVQTASTNIQAIIDAPQAATDAESARDTAIATLNEFKGQYYGSLASDPTLDPLGNPVGTGDIYWNSTAGELRAYNGSNWEPATATASNVGFDDTTTGLGETNVQGAIVAVNTKASAIDAKVEQVRLVQVRQTVLTGDVDANGRADFIVAGTGLQAVSTNSNTLRIAFGNGFAEYGESNLIASIDDVLEWNSLTDEATNFLYVDLDGESITAGSALLEPIYSQARPSSPATGQYWYPTDHRSSGEVWDGTAWNPVLRVFVGEAVASGGVVVSIVSYAYQGKCTMYLDESWTAGLRVYAHNIGAESKCTSYLWEVTTSTIGYSAGDEIEILSLTRNDRADTTLSNGIVITNERIKLNITLGIYIIALQICDKNTGTIGSIANSGLKIRKVSVERGF